MKAITLLELLSDMNKRNPKVFEKLDIVTKEGMTVTGVWPNVFENKIVLVYRNNKEAK